MSKRAIIVALLLTAATVYFGSTPAEAHTPNVQATCSGLQITLTQYEGNSSNNTVTVTIDGASHSHNFGGSFSETHTWDQFIDHTWSVVINANKVQGHPTQYDKTFTGTQVHCQETTTSSTTTTTVASTTTTTTIPPSTSTSTDPATTTTAPQTTTTVSPTSSTTTLPVPSSVASSTSVNPTTVPSSTTPNETPPSTVSSTTVPVTPLIPETGTDHQLAMVYIGALFCVAGGALIRVHRRR